MRRIVRILQIAHHGEKESVTRVDADCFD